MTEFDDYFHSAFEQLVWHFGEQVIYKTVNQTETTYRGIVDREPPAIVNAAGEAIFPTLVVRLHDDDKPAVDVNIGGDQVKVAVKTGDTATWRDVFQVLDSDGGVTMLAVR